MGTQAVKSSFISFKIKTARIFQVCYVTRISGSCIYLPYFHSHVVFLVCYFCLAPAYDEKKNWHDHHLTENNDG